MCLQFVFLLVVSGWLPGRGCAGARNPGRTRRSCCCCCCCLLRHQLAVLRWQPGARPKPSWADRALIAALLGVIPRARQAGLRMIVAPDMVLRWHRAPTWSSALDN
jgi:hypothetical protein